MSLIEEALRKQREENEKSGSGTATPPPIPGSDSSETSTAEEPERRSWALVTSIVGGGLLAFAIIIWLLLFGLKLWQTKADTINTKTVAPSHSPPPLVAPPAVVQTNNIVKPIEPTPAPPAPLPALPTTTNPAPLPLPSASEPHSVPAVTNPVAEKATSQKPPIPAPTKLELPVIWPKITVSGIIGSSKNGRSAAIMNGQMLGPGESLEGVTVEAIDKQKVKLKYSGEVKSLSVGASTE